MLSLKNMALRHKIIAVAMLTCIAALLTVSAVFIPYEYKRASSELVERLTTQAEMIAESCKAALVFNDSEDAAETLNVLRADSTIVFAHVYTKDGEVFASYYRHPVDHPEPPELRDEGQYSAPRYVTVYRRILLDQEAVGWICLRADLAQMRALFHRTVMVFQVVLFIAALTAYLVGGRLQKVISQPILSLAEVAKVVSEKKDYSVRAVGHGDDEVKLLVDSFNEMLEQIQQRDAVLVNANERLEERVRERTEELTSINLKLAEEIAERSSAQRRLQRHVRQLNCFYSLSKLVEMPDVSLDRILQEAASLIRNAYQDPENTCVRITFGGLSYQTENFKRTEFSQYVDIHIRGEKAGCIETYLIVAKDKASPFLEEEHNLLNAMAEYLGRIAERNQTQEKLQLFRSLIDHSNDCIFVAEPEWGRFLDVNDRACELLGYSREQLLTMTFKDIDDSAPDKDSWHKLLDELEKSGESIHEGRFTRQDGTSFFAEVGLKLTEWEGKGYIVAVARDITDRKRAEQQQNRLVEQLEKVNEELKNFAYIVSHDLKAPLRGIKTLADWLLADYGDKLDEQGKEQLNLLVSRVERMHNLIEGVLQYSRVGRVREEHVPMDLNELVLEVVDMLAPPENIKITVDGTLPTVVAEKTRITQVFQNLLSNAVKYMDKPAGRIEVRCADQGDFWQFSITDNGPGIDSKYFDKIFQIFQTLSPRDQFESTGVGLSVVKKIVEMYGGRIWVESEVGKGTTFFFTLPKTKTGEQNDEKLKADIAC